VNTAELAQLITSIATLIGVVVGSLISLRNSAKIAEVHRTTNSLAKRNEEISRQLGVKEGAEQERSK
jgi:hypothetical protein